MKVTPRRLEGVFEIQCTPITDTRGYFMRAYDQELFASHGIHRDWVQENQSLTVKEGTVRGLHYQREPYTETKLVRAACGKILDVFVDLRKDSPTFGEWDSIVLSESNHTFIYIPRGFAHGFCTLTDHCIVQYKVDQAYTPSADTGVRWNDPDLAIQWPVDNPILSQKDQVLPTLQDILAAG